jgi:hypothetical protein
MLSCREASYLLSDRLDRPLHPWERFGLRIHLAVCRGCSQAKQQLQFIRRAMSELAKRRGEGNSARK